MFIELKRIFCPRFRAGRPQPQHGWGHPAASRGLPVAERSAGAAGPAEPPPGTPPPRPGHRPRCWLPAAHPAAAGRCGAPDPGHTRLGPGGRLRPRGSALALTGGGHRAPPPLPRDAGAPPPPSPRPGIFGTFPAPGRRETAPPEDGALAPWRRGRPAPEGSAMSRDPQVICDTNMDRIQLPRTTFSSLSHGIVLSLSCSLLSHCASPSSSNKIENLPRLAGTIAFREHRFSTPCRNGLAISCGIAKRFQS
ncbi:uncharacterized protein FN964_010551 isoform 1-T1 [Alca torda]